jgi:HSP20 family protein
MLPMTRNGSARTSHATPANRLATVFDQLFDDRPYATAWTAVPLAVWEDEDKVTVEVDVPGVSEGDIDLEVHDGVLAIRAERKRTGPETMCDTRSYGRFEQKISLPKGVEAERVEAKLKDGVLTVGLPKSPATKPRKISLSGS